MQNIPVETHHKPINSVLLSHQINEMTKEVLKLKEALNSLSQLSYSTSSSKRQSQQLETLQQQVKQLQTQLAVSVLPRLSRGGEWATVTPA